MIRKAVVLARGLGTRMRRPDETAGLDPVQEAAAASGAKAMMSFGRSWFLDYVLSALADAGVMDVCLVIGPGQSAFRQRYREAAPPRRVRVAFAVQPQARGTADAVLAAEDFAAGHDFLVINSDNLYPASALAALAELSESGVALFDRAALAAGGIPAERIAAFAVCVVGADGYLEEIVEKPDAEALALLGPDAPVSMNCWRFSSEIFTACRRVPLSPERNELELPMAVREAMAAGARFRVVRSGEAVLDLSQRADVAAVAERLRRVHPDP